jgi:hypothetical protein
MTSPQLLRISWGLLCHQYSQNRHDTLKRKAMRRSMQRVNTGQFVAVVTRNCVMTIIILTFTKHICCMLRNIKIASVRRASIRELWLCQLPNLFSVPRGSNWSPKPLILYVHPLWAICWLSCGPASKEISHYTCIWV